MYVAVTMEAEIRKCVRKGGEKNIYFISVTIVVVIGLKQALHLPIRRLRRNGQPIFAVPLVVAC